MNDNSYSISLQTKKVTCNIQHLNDVDEMISLYDIGNKNRSNKFLFVTDANVASQNNMQTFLSKFDDDFCGNDCLFVLGSGEPYKTIEGVMSIVDKALENNFSREDTFVAIGGGVICDITAFAASIYKRGLTVELIPTTFLAMIDSSIGGKTSCNRKNHKNIIGTFYPPKNIYYISDFIKSLPAIQIKSGLAEAFKIGLIADKNIYKIFKEKTILIEESNQQSDGLGNNTFNFITDENIDLIKSIIMKCSKAKAKLVEKDFTDENIRLALNLGHTFGYALETVVGMGIITHGEAVAWGIGRAVCLSYNLGYCDEDFKNEILSILDAFNYEINPEPSVVKGGGIGDRILKVMNEDKKKTGNKVLLVLPKQKNKSLEQEKNLGSIESLENIKGLVDIVVEEIDDSQIISVLR